MTQTLTARQNRIGSIDILRGLIMIILLEQLYDKADELVRLIKKEYHLE